VTVVETMRRMRKQRRRPRWAVGALAGLALVFFLTFDVLDLDGSTLARGIQGDALTLEPVGSDVERVLTLIALLVFGPKRLPDAGKALGQAIRGFKSSVDGKDEERPGGNVITPNACAGCGKQVEPEAAFRPSCGWARKDRAA